MKSLVARDHDLATVEKQLEILSDHQTIGVDSFERKLDQIGLRPLTATGVEIFQVNVGKMCNQVCKHCHVDAGPDRKEIMTKETMQQCLDAKRHKYPYG